MHFFVKLSKKNAALLEEMPHTIYNIDLEVILSHDA